MKPIEKDELYQHFSEFLKNKGIEMKDGNYTSVVQKGCSIMADAVNLTQQGMERAKTEIDKRLEQIRQVIHEKTAPKGTPRAAATNVPPVITKTEVRNSKTKRSPKSAKTSKRSSKSSRGRTTRSK
jgi:hypothetical protein